MNTIFLKLLLIFTCISLNAAEKPNFKLCKQKQIPFEVSSSYAQNLLQVKIKAETAVSEFSIIGVRGLDGVTISKFNELKNVTMNVGDTTETQIEISNLTGLAYVVIDLEYNHNGSLNKKNIILPLGSLSAGQIQERKKNIKTIKVRKHSSSGQQKAVQQDTTENVHYMKIN